MRRLTRRNGPNIASGSPSRTCVEMGEGALSGAGVGLEQLQGAVKLGVADTLKEPMKACEEIAVPKRWTQSKTVCENWRSNYVERNNPCRSHSTVTIPSGVRTGPMGPPKLCSARATGGFAANRRRSRSRAKTTNGSCSARSIPERDTWLRRPRQRRRTSSLPATAATVSGRSIWLLLDKASFIRRSRANDWPPNWR